MLPIRLLVRGGLSALAAGVLLTNGCALPHADAPPGQSIGRVSPALYCPGDVVSASYNLTQEQPCVSRPGFSCPDFAPTITVSGVPADFAPLTSTGFTGNVDFTPSTDSTAVTFTAASSWLVYPVVSMSGVAGLRSRMMENNTATARRLAGTVMRTVEHGGMCAGSQPVNADGVIPGPPELSPSLRLRTICNASAVPIRITVPGAPGSMLERDLAPGQCFDTSEPGVPAEAAALRTYAVRALTVDPNAQCSALQGMTPPASLRTTVTLGCGQ